MIRTTSTRLAEARQLNAILATLATVLLLSSIGMGAALAVKPAQAADVQMSPASARTAYAKCGAYDVLVIGHDFASADDARKAAFSYLGDHCEVGRGLPPKD